MLIGAAQSGTITVFRMGADGQLAATDQVGDDLTTRFQSVSALATVSLDGRAYVIAGGADDGLSLLELLPGGRLLHRDTIADDLGMALTNPGALVARARDGGIDIFAAGQGTEPGLTLLQVDPGAAGNLQSAAPWGSILTGGAGNDTLYGGTGPDQLLGGAGDDVLRDGAGTDVLTGGAGADVFIFTSDGQTDRVTDFQPGIDRLDLSALGRFYTVGALDIRSITGGAQINLGTEVLNVFTADGRSLGPGSFDISDLRDIWHLPVSGLPAQSLVLRGGAGEDTPEGADGDDLMDGGANEDILNGDEGSDTMLGGLGEDVLNGGNGIDLLTGGDDADVFIFAPGEGPDTITDFEDGLDIIDLTFFGPGPGLTAFQSGADVDISVNGEYVVTLQNFLLTDVTLDDFLLV